MISRPEVEKIPYPLVTDLLHAELVAIDPPDWSMNGLLIPINEEEKLLVRVTLR